MLRISWYFLDGEASCRKGQQEWLKSDNQNALVIFYDLHQKPMHRCTCTFGYFLDVRKKLLLGDKSIKKRHFFKPSCNFRRPSTTIPAPWASCWLLRPCRFRSTFDARANVLKKAMRSWASMRRAVLTVLCRRTSEVLKGYQFMHASFIAWSGVLENWFIVNLHLELDLGSVFIHFSYFFT